MSGCAEEEQTQHYRGKWAGHGPVRNEEVVLFAVFDSSKRQGLRLVADSFRNGNLAKRDESVARASYVTKRGFFRHIVEPQITNKGVLVGIATANVDAVRKLTVDFQTPSGWIKVRAVCILDKVQEGDFDAHASLGYDQTPVGVNQGTLGKKRATIRLDLANTFSEARLPNEYAWPTAIWVLLEHCRSLLRAINRSTRLAASGPSTPG